MDRVVSNFSECLKEFPKTKYWREEALSMQVPTNTISDQLKIGFLAV